MGLDELTWGERIKLRQTQAQDLALRNLCIYSLPRGREPEIQAWKTSRGGRRGLGSWMPRSSSHLIGILLKNQRS